MSLAVSAAETARGLTSRSVAVSLTSPTWSGADNLESETDVLAPEFELKASEVVPAGGLGALDADTVAADDVSAPAPTCACGSCSCYSSHPGPRPWWQHSASSAQPLR